MAKEKIRSAHKHVLFEAEVETPTSVYEIQKIVNYARGANKKVKVIGGKHSFNHIFRTDDILLDLKNLKLDGIKVNKPNLEVTVAAGHTIREIVEECDKHGLHFPSLGSYHAQTIPGAIATSTHGSSLIHGSLSDIVLEVEAVLADGSVQTFSGMTPQARAMRCHLGQLGILTRVKLRLVPAFWLHCRIISQDAPQAFAQILNIARTNDYVSMLWIPDTDIACTRVLLNGVPLRNEAAIELERSFNKWSICHRLHDVWVFAAGHIYLCKCLERCNPLRFHSWFHRRYCSGVEKEFCFDNDIIDKSYRVFLYDHYREPTENHWLRLVMNVEYAIDVAQLEDLLNELKLALDERRKNGQYLHFPRVHVRFAPNSDKTLIGLNTGRDTAYVAFYVVGSIRHKSQFEVAKTVEKIFIQHGGRPHWGKYSYVWREKNKSYLRQALSNYGANYRSFLKVRDELDPNKMFLSSKDMFEGLELFEKPPIGAMVWSVFDPNEYQKVEKLP